MTSAPLSPPDLPVTPPPPSPPGHPRLVRPRDDRVVAGVASGIARHLGLDPVLIRLAFVVLVLAGGSGVLAYLIGWLTIPEEPLDGAPPVASTTADTATLRLVAGGLLVLLGLSWLLGQVLPGVGRVVWPLALIVIGTMIALAGARR